MRGEAAKVAKVTHRRDPRHPVTLTHLPVHLLLHHAHVGHILLETPLLVGLRLLRLAHALRLRLHVHAAHGHVAHGARPGHLLVVAVDDDAVDPTLGPDIVHLRLLPRPAHALHTLRHVHTLRAVHLVHHLLLLLLLRGDVPGLSAVAVADQVKVGAPAAGARRLPSRLRSRPLRLLPPTRVGRLPGVPALPGADRLRAAALRLGGGGGSLDVQGLARAAVGPAAASAGDRLERLARPSGGGVTGGDGSRDGELRGLDRRVVGVRARLAERDERLLHRRVGVAEHAVAACDLRGDGAFLGEGSSSTPLVFGVRGERRRVRSLGGDGRVVHVARGLRVALALERECRAVAARGFGRGRRVEVRVRSRRRSRRGDGSAAVLRVRRAGSFGSLAEDLGDLRLDVIGGRREGRGCDGVVRDGGDGSLGGDRGDVGGDDRGRDNHRGDDRGGLGGWEDGSTLDGTHGPAAREPEPARVAQRAHAVGPASHERRGVAGAPAVGARSAALLGASRSRRRGWHRRGELGKDRRYVVFDAARELERDASRRVLDVRGASVWG